MTKLDDYLDAMASPPDFAAQPLDLGSVMAAGGRIRRRRRLATGAASAVAVVGLLVGGAQLVGRPVTPGLTGPGQVADQPTGPATAPPTTGPTKNGILGDVVQTGVGGWLIYAESVDLPELPDTHFGVSLGRAGSGGTPVTAVVSNETEGPGLAPGFHAVEGAMEADGKQTMMFGYYVGPAKKITAATTKKKGRAVAKQAVWSEDPSVVLFWFDPASGASSDLTAVDKNGQRLPAGHNSVAVG